MQALNLVSGFHIIHLWIDEFNRLFLLLWVIGGLFYKPNVV